MNVFNEKIGNNLFQVYIIESKLPETRDLFIKYLESIDIKINGNPNVLNERYESFTIDNVRTLSEHHTEKSANEGKKIFIIQALTINHEAHHALLKMFEEPTENTHFFFLLPQVDILPDTLKSRVHIIYEDHMGSVANRDIAHVFIHEDIKERIDFVGKIVIKHKDALTSAPLRDEARGLLDACEFVLRKQEKKIDDDTAWKLNEILKAKKYLSTSGASVKMILEHIALVI